MCGHLNALRLEPKSGGHQVAQVADGPAAVATEQEATLLGVVERSRLEPQPHAHLHNRTAKDNTRVGGFPNMTSMFCRGALNRSK